MKTQIVRLEEALRFWENSLFLTSAIGMQDETLSIAKLPELSQYLPLKTHDFRGRLLGSRTREFTPEMAFGTEDIYNAVKRSLGHGRTTLPQLLWSWSRRSRRSYTLAPDLQLQLAGTALSSIRTVDISWPFDTFGIALSEPVLIERSSTYQHAYDYLLVSRDERLLEAGNRDVTVILLLCRHLTGMKYMPLEDRKRIAKEARRGKDVGRFWDRYNLDQLSLESCINVIFTSSSNENFVDSLAQRMQSLDRVDDGLKEKGKAFLTIVNRIVFGLCLYLSSLTPDERRNALRWSKGKPVRIQRADPHRPETITDEAEVCMVTSVDTISSRDRELLRQIMQSGREIFLPGPHFCQGHWRRPPGKGDNPSAPRTVWVRPYQTGLNQLGENELPGGAIMKVK